MSESDDPGLDPTQELGRSNEPISAREYSFSVDDQGVERIGRYVLLDKLGQGAFGVVYRAEDEILKRHVAIKVLTRFDSIHQMDAWVQEGRVLAALDHPSIVPVFDVGKTDSDQPFIVSKLIDGGNLAERSRNPDWGLEDSIRVTIELSHALDYLHRRGVMHRDIKPNNILLTTTGKAVLVDFGLALPDANYGKGARFVGTPAYMSPEQARHEGHRVDGRSDIYSLGVVMYELLTQTRPFRADNKEELLECIRSVEVRPLRQINASVPKELERICLKTLCKKASDRYSTAADLAEDLEEWRNGSLSITQRGSLSHAPGSQSITQSARPEEALPNSAASSESRSVDLDTIAVVPHGLRPFDRSDSDFFRFLVPGARDRLGIPDSIQFWVKRIRSREPRETFRVGVLMGLSGSGKSSLMKAGVLPLVGDDIVTVFLEAKPDSLESDLHKAIRREFPSLSSRLKNNDLRGGATQTPLALVEQREEREFPRPTANMHPQASKDDSGLRELLIQVREHGKSTGKKLLIVIDQFEQWLNHHREAITTSLHDSLRQCDGATVQAILLVRDDFMLGLSGFMDAIDESLLQNDNFATIEPFGAIHAQKVLGAFGRAYGVIRDPITADQESFIQQAVAELANAGRLEPVQLALLSEMIKSKPWTPNTLKALGGVRGLGVAFLEERLAGPSAHPILRSNLPVVQMLLRELLPVDDAVIKPPACTHSALVDRMRGMADEELIRKVLQLIDTEVRLITPTSNANLSMGSATGSATGSSVSDPAYQLTHDYLVPTTRQWLSAQNAESKSGRAREQLREIATVWSAKPSSKRLPTISEWAAIRWYVPYREWNPTERRMMAVAQNRIGASALLGILLITGLFASFRWVTSEMEAKSLALRLTEASTDEVVPILQAIQKNKSRVLTHLELPREDQNSSTDDSNRKRLHVALARCDTSSDEQEYVLSHLSDIDDRKLEPLIGYLASSRWMNSDLPFRLLQQAIANKSDNVIPLAAILSTRFPDDQRWEENAKSVCDSLLRKSSVQLAFWPRHFFGIRKQLVPVLLALGASNDSSDSSAQENLVSLLSILANDDSNKIAQALVWAPYSSLPSLMRSIGTPKSLAVELREQLQVQTARKGFIADGQESLAAPPSASLRSLIDSFQGEWLGTSGWLERVPLDRLAECGEIFARDGFVIQSVRLFGEGLQQRGAISFGVPAGNLGQNEPAIAPSKPTIVWGLSASEFQSLAKEWQEAKIRIVDFCSYRIAPSDTGNETRWLTIGYPSPSSSGNAYQVLTLGESNRDRVQPNRRKLVAGLVPVRCDARVQANGELAYDTLWEPSNQETAESFDWSRVEFANGDLFPAYFQNDIRCKNILDTLDRSRKWQEYFELGGGPEFETEEHTPREIVSVAGRASACGRLEEALRLLTSIDEEALQSLPNNERSLVERSLRRHLGRTLARMEKTDELKSMIDSIGLQSILSEMELAHLKLRLALLSKDASQFPSVFTGPIQVDAIATEERDAVMRSFALIASQSWLDSKTKENAFRSLVESVSRWRREDRELVDSLLDCDYDLLRNQPDWRATLDTLGLTRRYTNCVQMAEGMETKVLHAKSWSEFRTSCRVLTGEGYRLSVLHVHDEPSIDSNTNAKGSSELITSLWSREKPSQQTQAKGAQRVATICLALGMLGETDAIQDALAEKFGRGVQTAVIANAYRTVPPSLLLQLLKDSSRPKIQTALISAFGEYRPDAIQEEDLRYLTLRLQDWARSSPHAAQMAMARWCLTQFGQPPRGELGSATPPQDSDWSVNSQGQTMVTLSPPARVLIGKLDERKFWISIDRDYSISTTEVSGEQFASFFADPRLQKWVSSNRQQRGFSLAPPSLAQNAVSWVVALQYCQWLNEKEGIPSSEWCYQNVWGDQPGPPIPAKDYLSKKGYRLPTFAEWQWACEGLSASPWHFGDDENYLSRFEWTLPHSRGNFQPIGELRPNAFGLFDMAGNVGEWTDDYFQQPRRETTQFYKLDSGNRPSESSPYRVLAGGRYKLGSTTAYSNYYVLHAPEYLSITTGFRLAKTIRTRP